MSEIQTVQILAADSLSIDSFGRWRCSTPVTLFDSKCIFDDSTIANTAENFPQYFDNAETSGGGTTTSYRPNEAAQRISVALNTAGTRVRQSKQRFNYQPGKSQLIIMTFCLVSLDSGVKKRVGYFDSNNGIFLELDGNIARFVQRSYVSGSPVDTQVVQGAWNIDFLNGHTSSGVKLDFTKTQILFIDFEWLGVGRVRCGFVVDGKIYYAHEFRNANNLATVYMSTPNLPVRYEITNNGAGAASNLDCICSTVTSEGGIQDSGSLKYTATTTHVDANAAGTIYALVGLRLKTAYLSQVINIEDVSLLEVTGSKDMEWMLIFNPTVAGVFTYSDLANTSVQSAYGATANTVTNGIYITGGFFSSSNLFSGGVKYGISSTLRLGSMIDGTLDTIVLCARPLTGITNADVWGSITWREAA